MTVPEDLRALHAVHDGAFAPLLPHAMTLLPYAAMLTTWRAVSALADEFSRGIVTPSADGLHVTTPSHRRRLPIATADDCALLLDFAPGPAGKEGQVLLQVDECDCVRVASSTEDLLSRWLQLLDEGRVRFSSVYGYALPLDGSPVEDLLRSS